MDDLKNLNPQYLEQLSLGLDVDELDEGEANGGTLSADERRRRSAGAQEALELLGIGGKKPTWYETYQQLASSRWPWRVACYVAWASSPKTGRWPKTQEELAKQVLGLASDRVIATWRKKSPDIDGAISLLQSATMLEHRADVFKALVESASTADHRSNPDRKLFFEMTGDYIPRSKMDLTANMADDDLASKSADELMRIARRAKESRNDDGE